MSPYAENDPVRSWRGDHYFENVMPQHVSPDALSYGERDLWCAVIAQAFLDMGAIAAPTSCRCEAIQARGRDYDEAVRWLLRDTKTFPYICDLAGVSSPVIRRAAQIFYGRTQLGAMHAGREPHDAVT